ncbi:MAG TPA: hypothetical protein V6D07_12550 [Trichocoleus sp.]
MALVLPACDNGNQQATSEQPQPTETTSSTPDPEQLVGQTVVVNGEVDEVYSPTAFSINADDTFGAGEKVLVLVSSTGTAGTGAAGAGTGAGTGGIAAGTGTSGTSTGTAGTGAASTDTGMGTGTSGTGATTGTGTGTASPGASTGTGTAGAGNTTGTGTAGTGATTGTSLSTADLEAGETVQLTGEVQRFTPDELESEYGITLDETLLSQLRQDYDGQPIIVTSSFDQLPAGASNSSP